MRIYPRNKPRVFITMGDPSGIGPEVIMKSVASPAVNGLAVFVIVADTGVMERASRPAYAGKFKVHPLRKADSRSLKRINSEISPEGGIIHIVDPGPSLKDVKPGRPTDEGSGKALECLAAAVGLMRHPPEDMPGAMVTAPVSKEGIARICPGFTGHTEYLHEAGPAKPVTMVMIGETLCVVPVTRHIPLKDVASRLTADLLAETLVQVSENRLLICGKKDAIIGVCALNPHCGEGGSIGREEIDIIVPAIEKARDSCGGIKGPISADVIFYKAMKKEIDIVVSMYHDQCLAPFKMVDFNRGVNMTLGLGYVRTSPGHGTAFDIAGKGIADPGSMERAIEVAVRAATQA